jgi:hypothetical protein
MSNENGTRIRCFVNRYRPSTSTRWRLRNYLSA